MSDNYEFMKTSEAQDATDYSPCEIQDSGDEENTLLPQVVSGP
jgi:hypothetical protein